MSGFHVKLMQVENKKNNNEKKTRIYREEMVTFSIYKENHEKVHTTAF